MSLGGGGKTSKENEKITKEESGTRTSQLELDQEAISKIIDDVLGGTSGLASIFGGEQNAGIFDSTVAAQASGDLAANIVGELAKITGKTVETSETSSLSRRKKEAHSAEINGSLIP
jgi:hypothetical protein